MSAATSTLVTVTSRTRGSCKSVRMAIPTTSRIASAALRSRREGMGGNPNDEARMTNQIRMTNDERIKASYIRHSEFVIVSSFGNSSFVIAVEAQFTKAHEIKVFSQFLRSGK